MHTPELPGLDRLEALANAMLNAPTVIGARVAQQEFYEVATPAAVKVLIALARRAQPEAEAPPLDDGEVARLRRVVRALDMESEVPEDDASLRGCLFSVLGMIALKLERAQQAAAPGALDERDPTKPAEQQGLFRKFEVRRTDGSDQPGGKHHGCRYYVLDLDHDTHAPAAMQAYAAEVLKTHPHLAADIEVEFGPAPSVPGAPEAPARLSGEEVFDIAAPYFAWNAPSWHKATQGTIVMTNLLGFAEALLNAKRAAQLDGGAA